MPEELDQILKISVRTVSAVEKGAKKSVQHERQYLILVREVLQSPHQRIGEVQSPLELYKW